MNKKLSFSLLVIGVLLIAASVVTPVISTVNANVIGGAGWPTFVFYLGKTAWLAVVGVCLTIVSAVMLAKYKK